MATRALRPDEPMYEGEVDPDAAEEQQRVLAAMDGVIQALHGKVDDAVRRKASTEKRWLEDERAYHGRYDAETESNLAANQNKSRAIINMTRPKTDGWEARLSDLLFPADDKNWGISPTPVPELIETAQLAANEIAELHAAAAEQADEADRQMMAAMQQDGGGDPQAARDAAAGAMMKANELGALAKAAEQREAQARAELQEAKRRSERMQLEIDDQLTEAQYAKRSRDVIGDACRLGSGIMKGPLFAKPTRRWRRAEGGPGGGAIYQLTPVRDERPIYKRINPWSYFPDPNATSTEECEFDLERHLPNRSKLRRMAKELDFDRAAVRALLQEGPSSDYTRDLDHLTQLRAINDEGEAVTGRYVVWEYHGIIEKDDICSILKGLGRDDDATRMEQDYDELDELRVVIWFCDGKCLKIEEDYVLDSGETLYSVFSFAKSEASVLGGVGVPTLMRDPARALSAAWRMMLDNGALAVGPQVVVDKSQVEPEDGSWKLVPRKVWKRTGQGDAIGPQARPFETFDIPMNQAQLAGIIELALRFIDEVVSLPLIAQGEQGSHVTQTAGGMSMLFNSANVIFRRVVKNWDDDITTPAVRRLYDWNMQFSKKDEIKGDMQVEARGTSVLLVKEVQSQNLMAIATNWSTHPVLGTALKPYEAMRMTIQSLNINPDDVMLPRDEYERRLKDLASQGEQSPDVIRAQASIEVAKISAASRVQDAETSLKVATMNQQTEMLRLAQDKDVKVADLQAMLRGKELDLGHKERMKAVDVAVENQRAAAAAAAGESPSRATGQGVG